MKKVYYQHPVETESCFEIYSIDGDIVSQSFSLHENLRTVLKKYDESFSSETTFLLDDQLFSFFKFDIFRKVQASFSSEDLNALIDEKKFQIKVNNTFTSQFWVSYIDTIYVDSQPSQHIIGQKGEIFFRLYLVYIDDLCLNTFKSYGLKDFRTLTLLPQSFYTMVFVRNNMQRNNFALLYITKDIVKVVLIQNGFYTHVNIINLGLSFLKKVYKDNGVLQYWNQSEEEILSNPVAADLVSKSLLFYSQMLFKWLTEQGAVNIDIFLISSILKNGLFIDIFNREHQKASSSNYIIPFHHSSILKNYGKKWDPGEMDILIYLNRENFILDNSFILSTDMFSSNVFQSGKSLGKTPGSSLPSNANFIHHRF